jgi:hypothetical protein
MHLRFYCDSATGEPHIYNHGVTAEEVEEVIRWTVSVADRPDVGPGPSCLRGLLDGPPRRAGAEREVPGGTPPGP